MAAVTAPGVVVEAFDAKAVPTIGRGDTLIFECPRRLSPDKQREIRASWDDAFDGMADAPKACILDGGVRLAGIIKGEGHAGH